MRFVFFCLLPCALSLFSTRSFAACESEIGLMQVEFPQAVGDQITFSLINEYQQMTISSSDQDLRDPATKAKYDLLYEAGYTNGIIRFGVPSEICQKLEEYRLPVGFGGSWSDISVTQLIDLKRVDDSGHE